MDEIAYVLLDSGARVLVADAEFADKATAGADEAGVRVRIAFGGPIEGFTDFEELVASGSPDEPDDEVAGAPMFYTSGTTGRPKGVRSNLQEVGGDPARRPSDSACSCRCAGSPKVASCCATPRSTTPDHWGSA